MIRNPLPSRGASLPPPRGGQGAGVEARVNQRVDQDQSREGQDPDRDLNEEVEPDPDEEDRDLHQGVGAHIEEARVIDR